MRAMKLAATLAVFMLVSSAAFAMDPVEEAITRSDLVAQEGMRRTGDHLAILTVMQLLVGVAGTAAILASLHMSQEALRASNASIMLQREMSQVELRAYLGWEDPIVEDFSASGGDVRIRFPHKNFGSSTASNVRRWSAVYIIDGYPKEYPIKLPRHFIWAKGRSVPPNAPLGWTFKRQLSASTANDIILERKSIVSACIWLYEDVFGDTHILATSEIRAGKDLVRRQLNPFEPIHPELIALTEKRLLDRDSERKNFAYFFQKFGSAFKRV